MQVTDVTEVDNTNYYLAIFTAILVIVTAVLAAITGYYAKQTKKSVIAIEESTRAQFKPFLKASIFHLGPEDIAIRISNIGKGPAEKIKIGKNHDGIASINLTEYVKQLPATIALYEEDPLKKISRNIENIKETFTKIERHLKAKQ